MINDAQIINSKRTEALKGCLHFFLQIMLRNINKSFEMRNQCDKPKMGKGAWFSETSLISLKLRLNLSQKQS